ncbi:MAG: response regulator [Acidobacteriota bacterium]|nr:response regulator [Acidobacteriota bacterium]
MFKITLSPNVSRQPRVLVADDDPVVRLLVTSVLKKAGYTPVVVEDGREAYRLLRSDADFKAAIFDMMMPHLGGIEVIRHMKTERRLMRIPVMLITSERDLKLMSESFAAGAAIFLPKPFTTGQLQLMLRMLLEKAEQTDALLRRVKDNQERPATCVAN